MPSAMPTARYVFMRDLAHQGPLDYPYTGPYRVLRRTSKTFDIEVGDRTETVTVDRLKPAHLDLEQPVTVAQPPRRGRPPSKQPSCDATVPVPVVTRYGRISKPTKSYDASAGGTCVVTTRHGNHWH
jgi:hypothetical protein